MIDYENYDDSEFNSHAITIQYYLNNTNELTRKAKNHMKKRAFFYLFKGGFEKMKKRDEEMAYYNLKKWWMVWNDEK